MARKKDSRITGDVVHGESFMWKPRKVKKTPTACPMDCGGHVVRHNKRGLEYFTCSTKSCDWDTIPKERGQSKSKMQTPRSIKPRKKQRVRQDAPELVKAVRKECKRRDSIIRRERRKINKPTRRLTQKEREHLHQFGFSSTDVRDELKGQ